MLPGQVDLSVVLRSKVTQICLCRVSYLLSQICLYMKRRVQIDSGPTVEPAQPPEDLLLGIKQHVISTEHTTTSTRGVGSRIALEQV